MSAIIPHPDLHQNCLDKLNRALDLVLKSAETASAAGNHKVVIQAAREVTRMVTLITKITDPKGKSKPPASLMSLSPGKRENAAPSPVKNHKTISPPPGPQAAKSNRQPGQHPPAGVTPNLKGLFRDKLFQPDKLDDLDPLSFDILPDMLK